MGTSLKLLQPEEPPQSLRLRKQEENINNPAASDVSELHRHRYEGETENKQVVESLKAQVPSGIFPSCCRAEQELPTRPHSSTMSSRTMVLTGVYNLTSALHARSNVLGPADETSLESSGARETVSQSWRQEFGSSDGPSRYERRCDLRDMTDVTHWSHDPMGRVVELDAYLQDSQLQEVQEVQELEIEMLHH